MDVTKEETKKLEADALPESWEDVCGWFASDVLNLKIQYTREMYERLVENAHSFLMAGGEPPKWERWAMLSATERNAWNEAMGAIVVRKVLEKR